MKASPVIECNCIDLGAVAFWLKQVQQSGIRFYVQKLRWRMWGRRSFLLLMFMIIYTSLRVVSISSHNKIFNVKDR